MSWLILPARITTHATSAVFRTPRWLGARRPGPIWRFCGSCRVGYALIWGRQGRTSVRARAGLDLSVDRAEVAELRTRLSGVDRAGIRHPREPAYQQRRAAYMAARDG